MTLTDRAQHMCNRHCGCGLRRIHQCLQAASVEAVISIAVLHHMSSTARRLGFLAELARVLVPGGTALVTVWASEQEDRKKLAKWEPIPASNTSAEGKASVSRPALHTVQANLIYSGRTVYLCM